jgi:hypothetical protein
VEGGVEFLSVQNTAENIWPKDKVASGMKLLNLTFSLLDSPSGSAFKNFTFCLHRIYVGCAYLGNNSDFCPI